MHAQSVVAGGFCLCIVSGGQRRARVTWKPYACQQCISGHLRRQQFECISTAPHCQQCTSSSARSPLDCLRQRAKSFDRALTDTLQSREGGTRASGGGQATLERLPASSAPQLPSISRGAHLCVLPLKLQARSRFATLFPTHRFQIFTEMALSFCAFRTHVLWNFGARA